MKGKKYPIMTFFGILFILLGVLAVLIGLWVGNYDQVFWYCYFALVIIGIGLLKKNSFIILSQLNVLVIPSVIWNLDFFYRLLTQQSLFGITDYFFEEGLLIGKIVSLQHIFTVPICIYLVYKLKVNRKDTWKASIISSFLILLASRILTDRASNINCVYESCLPFIKLGYTQYVIIGLSSLVCMIILTNYLLTLFLFKKGK